MSLFDIFGGGMLTGREIEKQIKKGRIQIDSFDPNCLNPNSYNLKLYDTLKVYSRGRNISFFESRKIIKPGDKKEYTSKEVIDQIFGNYERYMKKDLYDPIDMNTENNTYEIKIPETGYVLEPGILYLGRTVERTSSNYYIPMINGRSSGGRLGMSIHVCAGFGDIGFDGTWTLEITVVEPLIIYPNREIAQVCYFKPYGLKANLYKGRYQNQKDATASKFYIHKDSDINKDEYVNVEMSITTATKNKNDRIYDFKNNKFNKEDIKFINSLEEEEDNNDKN